MVDEEFVRKTGLSNGLVLDNNKRTLNVESGRYLKFYNDLDKNSGF